VHARREPEEAFRTAIELSMLGHDFLVVAGSL